ncbi:LacI family transcriptional regulator [Propioniciclava coleopterorum]|uniref:LacI family transcriptional regulator n=2 Tax=Propioniciclava coleopterorum TaxID=2714937 RepID=A0A6G7YAW8_9ACTN|nr:LacI family transcriptional regulator [Propioniciclava coleopterorum]
MHDVARLAGVSAKTVSNVINGYPHVREATRAKVQLAIDKLGYELNVTARNLRLGRTGLITLALPELKLPYFAEFADEAIRAAEARGLRVLIEQTNADRARELAVLHGVRRVMTDGLIFSPLALGPDDIRLFQVDFPLVLLGERVFGSGNDHVAVDNVAGARAATQHLIEGGRRRIAVVGSHPDEPVGAPALRERGYREALAGAGIAVDEALIRPGQAWHMSVGAQLTDELIASGVAFDAVFALNDALALGVLHSLHQHRIKVPAQVAVIGFDDVEESAYVRPTLSSVSPGREQIATTAIDLLLQRIAESPGTPAGERAPARRVLAEFSLVPRQSSGAR